MSVITTKTALKGGKKYKMMIEQYNSSREMVKDLRTRTITDGRFKDQSRIDLDADWCGVKSYRECIDYLQNGYQPTVDALKTAMKPTVQGEGKRISFKNDIVGGMPIVPLAMMGIPNSMINTHIKPIKAKVIDVYYDLTCGCGTSSEDIIDAGQKLLATILKLEQQGYKFNLYAVQTYSDDDSCDMLAIKVKSSDQPVDIKRMSYALTHTSFFRVLGFDWYSKTPKGTHRWGYGSNLAYQFGYDGDATNKFTKSVMGNNSIYLAAMVIVKKNKKDNSREEYIESIINPK